MKISELNADEIKRRMPLWLVMADLFLDTEPTRSLYLQIAETISDGGYSLSEAEDIFRQDVALAFWTNLLPPAGEWSGWPEGFVHDQVLKQRGSLKSRFGVWLFFRKELDREWDRISTAVKGDQPTSAVNT